SCHVNGFVLFISYHLDGMNCPVAFFFSSRRRHTRSVSAFLLNRSSDLLLNLLLRLVAFLLFLNPQCLASISRWITASSSWKRFCLFVCRALSSIMVICMLTAISCTILRHTKILIAVGV